MCRLFLIYFNKCHSTLWFFITNTIHRNAHFGIVFSDHRFRAKQWWYTPPFKLFVIKSPIPLCFLNWSIAGCSVLAGTESEMTNSRFWHAPVTPTWFELTVSTKAQARKKTKLTFLSYILRNFKRESKSNFPVTCADARILPKPARFEWTFWDDGETEKRGARSGEFRGTRYQTRQHTTRYPSARIFTHIKNVVFLGRNI